MLSKVFEKLFERSWIAPANLLSLFDERAYTSALARTDPVVLGRSDQS